MITFLLRVAKLIRQEWIFRHGNVLECNINESTAEQWALIDEILRTGRYEAKKRWKEYMFPESLRMPDGVVIARALKSK